MSAICHFNKFVQNREVRGCGWLGGVTLQITHLKCDCEGAGGNHCFSLKVQFFEIFVVITGGNNLFYWWTRGRKCASRQVLIARLCPVLEKDRILCHCSPGHQLFNFIISTYDRYFFSSLGNLGINRRANNLCQRSFGNGTKKYHVALKNTFGRLLAGIILIYWWIHGVIRRLVFLGLLTWRLYLAATRSLQKLWSRQNNQCCKHFLAFHYFLRLKRKAWVQWVRLDSSGSFSVRHDPPSFSRQDALYCSLFSSSVQ